MLVFLDGSKGGKMAYKEVLDEREKTKIRFIKTQMEKGEYLGEFKENVIAALKKDQLEEDDVYIEIIEAMKEGDVSLLKMRRDVSLDRLKPYIREAENLGLRYQLVDGLSYRGEIALVVVSKDALDNADEDVVIRDMDQDFIDAGLDEELSKARGQKICKECYKKIKDTLPEYLGSFKKMGILDKLLGNKCPGCTKK